MASITRFFSSPAAIRYDGERPMLSISLQSGSNGNCIYVEAGGVRLLFDAGISGQLAETRLAARGRDLAGIDALIISHEHIDHVRGVGVIHRRHAIPLYITRHTLRRSAGLIGRTHKPHHFAPGERIEFGPVTVYTIPTPHDAVEPVCFVVAHENKRLGILTDLGHPFAAIEAIMQDLDAAYLESNYDPEMLETGPYSKPLKDRIRGKHGHISNHESADLASRTVGLLNTSNRLKWIAAAHLSEINNDPELVLAAHRQTVGRDFPVHVASRHAVGDVLEV